MNEQEPVVVVFRKWHRQHDGNGVIALFPDASRPDEATVTAYEHIGQHGPAHYESVIERTRAATPTEYADLKRELESAPRNYNLIVRKRRPGRQRSHRKEIA